MSDTQGAPCQGGTGRRWLLLLHQLPPKPDYVRVKIRRRLHDVGAVPIKSSVYLLPATDEALEDCHWLIREIKGLGGTAILSCAEFLEGITDEEIEARLREGGAAESPRGRDRVDQIPPGTTWVTREGVKVDRIASSWLIQRFIDPKARFKFVAARGYRPKSGELRFDMFDAEYTHEADRCTFQTMVHRFRLEKRALVAIGEIVHDIDCKDALFQRPETTGVAELIRGIVASTEDDEARLRRGAALFDDLYQSFRSRRSAP